MRARVSAPTPSARSLSTRDTVALETPARAAMSAIVSLPMATLRERNRFTKTVSLIYTIAHGLASAAIKGGPMANRADLYRHVVLFKFRESASAETVVGIESAFRALCAGLPFVNGP